VKLGPYAAWCAQYGLNSSHTIYTVRPRKNGCYKYMSVGLVVGLATADIGRRVAEATIAISLKDAHKLYEFVRRMGETKTSAGWVFEARMHQIFQCGGSFKATKLGGSTAITIGIDHKACKDLSKASEFGSLLRKHAGSPSINPDIIGGYFKHQHGNLRSVNAAAIARFATTDKPVLVLFQMTVSTLHPVKEPGLASIWAEILEELRETPPIFVFVVPTDIASTFAEQTIGPAGSRTSASNTPDFDKWEQYVLSVSDKVLW